MVWGRKYIEPQRRKERQGGYVNRVPTWRVRSLVVMLYRWGVSELMLPKW